MVCVDAEVGFIYFCSLSFLQRGKNGEVVVLQDRNLRRERFDDSMLTGLDMITNSFWQLEAKECPDFVSNLPAARYSDDPFYKNPMGFHDLGIFGLFSGLFRHFLRTSGLRLPA